MSCDLFKNYTGVYIKFEIHIFVPPPSWFIFFPNRNLLGGGQTEKYTSLKIIFIYLYIFFILLIYFSDCMFISRDVYSSIFPPRSREDCLKTSLKLQLWICMACDLFMNCTFITLKLVLYYYIDIIFYLFKNSLICFFCFSLHSLVISFSLFFLHTERVEKSTHMREVK